MLKWLFSLVSEIVEHLPTKGKKISRLKIAVNNRAQNWLRSQELTEEHIAKYDSSVENLRMLARLKEKNGDLLGAIETLDKVLNEQPDDPKVHLTKLNLLRKANIWSVGQQSIEYLLSRPETATKNNFKRSIHFYIENKNLGRAIEIAEKAVATFPEDNYFLQRQSKILMDAGQYEKALSVLGLVANKNGSESFNLTLQKILCNILSGRVFDVQIALDDLVVSHIKMRKRNDALMLSAINTLLKNYKLEAALLFIEKWRTYREKEFMFAAIEAVIINKEMGEDAAKRCLDNFARIMHASIENGNEASVKQLQKVPEYLCSKKLYGLANYAVQCFLDSKDPIATLITARLAYAQDDRLKAYRLYKQLIEEEKWQLFNKMDVSHIVSLLRMEENELIAYSFLSSINTGLKSKIKGYDVLKASLIAAKIKKTISMRIHYDINTYAGLELNADEWCKLVMESKCCLNHYPVGSKEYVSIVKYLLEVLISNAFYGEAAEDSMKSIDQVRDALDYIGINDRHVEIRYYILACAEYIFGVSSSFPEMTDFQENLTGWQLLLLERLSALLGFLSASYYFRERARDASITEFLHGYQTDQKSAKNALLAAIEANQKDAENQIHARIQEGGYSEEFKYQMTMFLSLMQGDRQKASSLFIELCNEDERQFMNFIQNKSVAIVAPAPSDLLSGSEIDSYDYTLRMSTFNHPKHLDEQKYGSKTDIGSFNVSELNSDKFIGLQYFDVTAKYILFKKPGRQVKDCFDTPLVKNRTFRAANYSLNGFVNHVPDISCYLLLAGLNKFKAFSMNFFLSNNAYDSKYRATPSLHSLIYIGDNLVVGHSYFKKLLSFDFADCDDVVRNVANLSTKEYMQKMEDQYRDSIRRKST